MSDLISVIITDYNYGKYIKKAIESIFRQTYKNLELIIINDGSTDNSDDIITELIAQADDTIAIDYVRQENKGIVYTRNLGIELANGSYFVFLDADDYFSDNYIEKMYETALSSCADVIYPNWNIIYSESDTISKTDFQEFNIKDYQLQKFHVTSESLVKKASIDKVRFRSDVIAEDWEFFNHLALEGKRFALSKTSYINYLVKKDGRGEKNSLVTDAQNFEKILSTLRTEYGEDKVIPANQLMISKFSELETRFLDASSHVKGLSEHIQKIEKLNADQTDSILTYEKHTANLEAMITELQLQKNYLESVIAASESHNTLILTSKSYKIGNLIIKTLKSLRHPSLLKASVARRLSVISSKVKLLPSPKSLILKSIRDRDRKSNNYLNPKRVLVYVIYESQSRLQTYKLHFLKALSKLSDEVLVVVNGSLPADDISTLSQFGEVKCRGNEGYDTAAFKFGIESIGHEKLSTFDELLLVNDTNVGPLSDLSVVFEKMAERKLDFWGISYGEPQPDFTGFNPYHTIPVHLQSYFLVIEKSLLKQPEFFNYWQNLTDTNSRDKAIGKHETVFTKYFEDLGFKHGAVSDNNHDSAMYIHPLAMIQDFGVPLVKYTAFANDSDDKFAWQGLKRQTEVPALLTYINEKTDYPMSIIDGIMADVKNKEVTPHILVIDGVENAIPQCTRYRVLNKVEQLKSFNQKVWFVNNSSFELGYAEHASKIIIYRCGYSEKLAELIRLAKKYNKPVYYDIDDLVIDTKYTDQLSYTQNLSSKEKLNYDLGVNGYGKLLRLCDGAITTTQTLKLELQNYQSKVLLNRNLASQELVSISSEVAKDYSVVSNKLKIAYFSGSITHNENFELIKPAVIQILQKYPNVELHLVGHLDIPKELRDFENQLVFHDYVDWQVLPQLIADIDINLAPLVDTVFNRAKSEIKWIEAALVKVPTLASQIGAFSEMIRDGETGVLVPDSAWFEKLEKVILSQAYRKEIGEKAYDFVIKNCVTDEHQDELIDWIIG